MINSTDVVETQINTQACSLLFQMFAHDTIRLFTINRILI